MRMCVSTCVRAATTPEPEPRGSQVLRLAASRRGAEVLPLPAETSREAPKCCAWQHRGGGPRNALGYRPEPEVLPLPAETSREAPECCAWQRLSSGTVQSLKCVSVSQRGCVCVEDRERTCVRLSSACE